MTWWHHFALSGVQTWLWLPPLAAFGISLVCSMVGVSGAFLLMPLQMSLFGFASPAASATNLVYNLVALPGAMLRFAREGRLMLSMALLIAAGCAPGVLAGAWLRTHHLAERAAFEPFVAAVLAWVAWRLWLDVRHGGGPPTAGRVHDGVLDRRALRFDYGGQTHVQPILPLLGLSFLVGVVGTAYGIGGGALIAPLLVALYRLPIHAIAGATLTATWITSALGLGAYAVLPAPAQVATTPDWALGVAFGVGGLAGASLGARLQRRMPGRALKGLMAVIVTALAAFYAWPG
ncbi:MAG: sulfite exporter TauE/SafE family protein [Thiobacillaceae bacterium]|nr:sulfite exporter TauE/SafE family protein [Thiobacillaceae bacterium]